MTHNVHIHNINIPMTKEKWPKFILSRKHPTWNYLCWKDTNHRTQPVVLPMSFTNLPITYKCTRNIFSPPQDSHWCITMTPIAISSYSTHLESNTILPLTFISNLTTSTEYTLRKLTYSSSKEKTTFHLGTLSSRYDIRSN